MMTHFSQGIRDRLFM